MEIRSTPVYDKWFDTLRDNNAKVRIVKRLRRLQNGNPGDVNDVGRGVSELKIDYGGGDCRYPGVEHMNKTRIGDLPVFDAVEHLTTPELQAAYIAAALEDGDSEEVLDAIALVARARGVAAPETDHPDFAAVLKALGDLGITLSARPSTGDKAA